MSSRRFKSDLKCRLSSHSCKLRMVCAAQTTVNPLSPEDSSEALCWVSIGRFFAQNPLLNRTARDRRTSWARYRLLIIAGLPGAKSEISGRNVYKISGQFQDIFVNLTRLKIQKMHVFLTS